MDKRAAIESELRKVAQENGVELTSLSDDQNLLESGLDSLGLATVVARLEDKLGIDPFSNSDDVSVPLTVGDFVKAYTEAEE